MADFPGLTLSVPLFFREDAAIDYASLEKYIYGLEGIKNIAAIYSMAYNTRYRMLDFDEVIEVNRFILEKAKDIRVPCYVGHPYIVNEKSFSSYLERIAKSEPAGISLLYPERYYGLDDPILEFMNSPQKFGLNSVVHEMKLVSGFNGELVDWPVQLIKDALAMENVVAIKEDSKNDDIAAIVVDECVKRDIACVLAGGGKRRALKFVEKGMKTWLNGTTMFFPQAIDKIYPAIMNQDQAVVDFYCEKIETPFFEQVAGKNGWHLAHKAALQYFGFGYRWERFPHPVMSNQAVKQCSIVFKKLGKSIDEFLSL